MNTFKGLDLVNRVPEEYGQSNNVHEIANKTVPKKNKGKKAQWLSEEALKIAEERREMKSKGEKERYTHLKAEFQRIARREAAF